jgi:hypothetical protein
LALGLDDGKLRPKDGDKNTPGNETFILNFHTYLTNKNMKKYFLEIHH